MKNLLKLGHLLVFALLMVSCGKDNTSGDRNLAGGIYGNGLGLPGGSGGPITAALYQENPCRTGNYGYPQQGYPQQNYNQRQRVSVRLQGVNVSIGSNHVGVTSEGDIASVFNDGSGPVMVMQICPRGNTASGQGQLMGNPIINKSLSCQVDEITKAEVTLPGTYGPLYLNFRPIHFTGSSLCGGYQNQYPY